MDLEIREALALSEDREAALAQLLPGSEDHDFYRCLHAQHAGDLAAAAQILEHWPERHGHTERYERLRMRQLLHRVTRAPEDAVDEVRDQLGAQHWHEAEVEEVDPTRPTRLPEGAFDGAALLQQAYAHDSNLSQVTDEGLHELVAWQLDASRRRVLLSRLVHTPQPEIVRHVADELDTRGSSGFGALQLHNGLTLEQLHALAGLRPELRGHLGWVSACVQRLRPPAAIDLEVDTGARLAYLAALWAFVAELPPAINTLKAHVLYHLLDTTRRLGREVDLALFAAYLALPRTASYLPRKLAEHRRSEEIAQLHQDLRGITAMPPVHDDEALVRELLHELLGRRPDDVAPLAQWLDRTWLETEVATATLLHGRPGADRATLTLGHGRAAALRDRIELQWCAHNPTRLPADGPIALDVDVKNVGQLVVKVFRIDPLAYFQHHRREVGTDLDLDGLAASHELVLEQPEPPVRRVRRRIELPMCTRPGTYVIDLIGNGMSSRALVHKGRLRHVVRTGAAGHVVTILDEAGTPRPDARAYLGEREYTPDETGAFVVPFSTAPAQTPMLLACGDLATVQTLQLVRETYQLAMNLVLDREVLTAGRPAKAIARVALHVAGAPASLALLQRPTWDVTLVDRDGVATTKSTPLELTDDGAAVLEWPMGEATRSVTVAIRATVEVRSEQRDQELSDARTFEVARIHGTTGIEALYLARTAEGWVISALGKTGEPRAQRPVTVQLVHRWARTQLAVELATDARGRIELGPLPGVEWIVATLGGLTQRWLAGDIGIGCALAAPAGRDVVLPLPPGRTAAEVARRLSLVELRAYVPAHHPRCELEPLEGGLVIRGLPPGDYDLRAPGVAATIAIAAATAEVSGTLVAPGETVLAPRPVPVLASVATAGDVRLQLRGATARTRVHVLATRFVPTLVDAVPLGPSRQARRQVERTRATYYLSGRELGDEYRYVLERRGHKRYPSLLLDKPSLLLNPWARRTTTTDIAQLRESTAYSRMAGAMAPPPSASAPAPRPQGATSDEAYASHDFLPEPTRVLANLAPDASGAIVIPRAELGAASSVLIVVDDPAGTTVRRLALPEVPLDPRDLRLRVALHPDRHATQQKTITPLVPGARLVIEDLATAKVHLLDSVARAHAYLLALRDDATLREFAFVTRWHELADAERRERYSKYACHELHLFLFHKDRAFFDAVVKPSLAHKRTKTFVDHWLLGADLAPYLEPAALGRLNAIERALLAQRLPADDSVARVLADQVAMLPPDPGTDTRLLDALLGASALDGDEQIATLQADAYDEVASAEATGSFAAMAAPAAPSLGAADRGGRAERSRAAPKAKKAARRMAEAQAEEDAEKEAGYGGDDDYLGADLAKRDEAAPHYRAVDKTQEWAEHNWWHTYPADARSLAAPNRFWRDLARHREGAFLSPSLGLAAGSFAEALVALAVTELPFVAPAHAIVADGPRLSITAAGNALAGSSQLVDGELVTGGAPLVVGMTYVRADDRHDWDSGEQRDKYVEGPFAVGVVYTCLIVLANPTSTRQRIAALVQIPRGSLPVAGGKQTHTLDVVLEAYGTRGHEYSFYFPAPGSWTHFPVHVTRADAIVAAAPGHTLEVTAGGGAPDRRSWAYVSQRGSLADVVAYLETANLAATELERVAWRLRDRAAYDAILGVLERRREYREVLWGYALLHRDGPRIRVWLRALGERLLVAGPSLEMLDLDAEALDRYEHLELAPLVNARAHRLGPKLRILNDGLAAQYVRFLELVTHRPAPTPEDLLAAAMYLVAQDRVADALAMLARVREGAITDRMQHDYLAAYLACLTGEVGRARELAARWREHPVDRWRHRFGALHAMLDELAQAVPDRTNLDPRSREQQHAELAARQPAFELAVDRDGLVITSQHVRALELRFFEMDIELLFSRQPFVQSDVSRFSFIEPGHREALGELPPEHRLPWPARLRGKNVVVEAVGHGQRKARVHYANDLTTSVSNQVGQLRVLRASDRTPLAATYVKVYARKHGGTVAFYKDGYTDLRGWFDYASLSTTDLDHVERFAILVCSDTAGAAILETSPPVR